MGNIYYNEDNGKILRKPSDNLVYYEGIPEDDIVAYWRTWGDKTFYVDEEDGSQGWGFYPGTSIYSNPHIYYTDDRNGNSGSTGAIRPASYYSVGADLSSYPVGPLTGRALFSKTTFNHNLSGTTDFSIVSWFEAADSSSYIPTNWSDHHYDQYRIGYFELGPYYAGQKQNNYNFFCADDTYYLNHNGSRTVIATGLTSGEWNHLGLIKSGSTLNIYLNGILRQQVATANPDNNPIVVLNNVDEGDWYSALGDGSDWVIQEYNFLGVAYPTKGQSNIDGFYVFKKAISLDTLNYIKNNT